MKKSVFEEYEYIAIQGNKYVPVKIETINGIETHTALYNVLDYPQSYILECVDEINFKKGFDNKKEALKAAFIRWGNCDILESFHLNETKQETYMIFEKDHKFVPVGISKNEGTQINSYLELHGGKVAEGGNNSIVGKVTLNFAKGFKDLKTAKTVMFEKWGQDIKVEHVKIKAQAIPKVSVKRFQNIRKARNSNIKLHDFIV